MTGSTDGDTTTTGGDTTTTGEDTTTTGEDTTTTGDDTTGGEACVEPDFDPDPKGASGDSCSHNDDCGGGETCYEVPLLGGLCGECQVDADCPDGGCTPPNLLSGVGAFCNTGKPGSGCQTDDVCDNVCNNICAVALDATPIIKISTCGACETSEDCSGNAVCAPAVSIVEFSGINECVPPGSLADDKTCSLKPGGGEACASGNCATATIMGVVNVGVCGACVSDADCDPGKTCSDAYADLETGEFFGSVCE